MYAKLNIIQRFSILSLFWVLLFVLVSGSLLVHHLERNMLERDGAITTSFIRARVKEQLSGSDFSFPSPSRKRLDDVFLELQRIPEIVSIKAYDTSGTVIWADIEGLIGQKSLQNMELHKAQRGETVVVLKDDRRPEDTHLQGYTTLLELYVPMIEEGRVVGVIGTYKKSDAFFQNLRKGKRSIWLMALTGGSLFYISFFGFFNRSYQTQKKLDEQVHRQNQYLLEFNRDLEKKVGERTLELKRSRDDIKAVFDAVTDIIVVRDLEHNIIMANQAAMKAFSLDSASIIGKKCYTLFRGCDTPCPECMASETVLYRNSKALEIKNTRTGEIFNISLYPVMNDSGTIQAFISYAKVVTLQKKMEEKVIQMEKLSSLGELIGEIAHQINNPLVGVVNYAQLALKELDDRDLVEEELETIVKAGLECKEIISKLLEFSRPSTFDLQLIGCKALLDDSLKMFERQKRLKEANITLEKRYTDGLPQVKVDGTLMTQVFFNIINNAIDAMPDGGKLTITAGIEGDHWLDVTISDTGMGIKEEDLPYIFSPFFSTKWKKGGTGLGLSVVSNIISRHNGKVWATSEPGVGTTFIVRLPVSIES